MPSFLIHLAVAKKYLEHHAEENAKEFYRGVIEPDLRDKSTSHFGEYSSVPDLNRYYNEVGLNSSFSRGYFLHLVTDYLFYNKFLKTFSKEIYQDYDKINRRLMEEYNIDISDVVREKIQFLEGKPQILNFDEVCKFINTVGMVELESYKKHDLHGEEVEGFGK